MTSAMFAKVAGSWQKVYPPAPPVEQYNEATGGTVTEYTATDGKRMRVHTFLAESTLTVTKEVKPFRVLCVGAGGGGHLYEGPNTGNAGGGGEVKDAEVSIPLGNHAITVGGGGYQGSGGPSSVGSIATAAGGERAYNSRGGYSGNGNRSGSFTGDEGQGGGGAGGPGSDSGGNFGGPGVSSDISGTAQTFGVGGKGGRYAASPGTANSGNGGNGGESWSSGGSGRVVVAYEVAPPIYNNATGGTTTEITDYNGTGEKWRIHTFTSGGTFTVIDNPQQFKALVVAGGTGAAYFVGTPAPGGAVLSQNVTVQAGAATVVVGAGGPGGQGSSNPGNPSSFAGIVANPAGTSTPVADTITGASVLYGGQGGTAGTYGKGGMGQANTGEGGQPGVVIIAYRIG